MRLFLVLVAVLAVASVGIAGEKAATSQLPGVLSGVADNVVSSDQAQDVRGTAYLYQYKNFNMSHGVAEGQTTLLEGMFGDFKFTSFENGGEGGTSLVVEGNVGGLTGTLGIDRAAGEMSFKLGGKAFTEKFDFAAKFDQSFCQGITIPEIGIEL